MKTYDDFLTQVAQTFIDSRGWRYGQAWYNVLVSTRPEIAHKITGTPMDPFHKNVVAYSTHEFVRSLW